MLLLLTLGVAYSPWAIGQNADHWSTYVQNPHHYRVISPFETLHTSFVGLQVDSTILSNEKQGFVLKEAGFRTNAQTGLTSCLELVYLANASAAPAAIEVELIAFDVRYPLQRAATYPAKLANVPNSANGTLVRCQIPVSGELTTHLGFVLVAKPPFRPLKAREIATYTQASLHEGHWAGSDNSREIFIYPATPGLSAYTDPTYVPEFADQEIVERVEEVAPMSTEEAPPPPPAPEPESSSEEVMQRAQKMPSFPGGEQAMFQFIMQNMKYPAEALQNGVEGTVAVQFVVNKDGSLSDIKLLKDIGAGCGEEALRVVKLMPRWAPGQHLGHPVRVQYTLPMRFHM